MVGARRDRALRQFDAVVTRSAEQFARPQQRARCGKVAVVTPQVRAGGTDLEREL